jgi:DnaJ family protein C protein 19
MGSSLIMAGLGMAAVGFAGRYAARSMPQLAQKMEQAAKTMPKIDSESWANSKYYKGGFDPKMNKREASLILGVSPTANIKKIRDAHKKIMILNHPDRGGSPYIASKINEAKDFMDK